MIISISFGFSDNQKKHQESRHKNMTLILLYESGDYYSSAYTQAGVPIMITMIGERRNTEDRMN